MCSSDQLPLISLSSLAKQLTQFASSHVYFYDFQISPAYLLGSYENRYQPVIANTAGAYHLGTSMHDIRYETSDNCIAAELPFLWNSSRLTSEEAIFAAQLRSYWGAFITNGLACMFVRSSNELNASQQMSTGLSSVKDHSM